MWHFGGRCCAAASPLQVCPAWSALSTAGTSLPRRQITPPPQHARSSFVTIEAPKVPARSSERRYSATSAMSRAITKSALGSVLLVAAAAAARATAPAVGTRGAAKPNVLLVLADDLDLTLTSSSYLNRTRALVGDQGVELTNAFVRPPSGIGLRDRSEPKFHASRPRCKIVFVSGRAHAAKGLRLYSRARRCTRPSAVRRARSS